MLGKMPNIDESILIEHVQIKTISVTKRRIEKLVSFKMRNYLVVLDMFLVLIVMTCKGK